MAMLSMRWMRELSTNPPCQLVRSPTRNKSQSLRRLQSTPAQETTSQKCQKERLDDLLRRRSRISRMIASYGRAGVLASVQNSSSCSTISWKKENKSGRRKAGDGRRTRSGGREYEMNILNARQLNMKLFSA